MSADGNAKALELFEKAVAADPRLSARAWADLAYTRAKNSTNQGGGPPGPLGQKRSRRLVGLSKSILATLALTRRSAMFWQCGETSDPAKPNSRPPCVSIQATPTSHGTCPGWASAFGRVERGAEMADHAIRLNPNYQVWQGFQFSCAHICSVGRSEDALRIPERLPKEKYQPFAQSCSPRATPRLPRAGAKATVADMLAKNPDLTTEGFTGTADWSDADRETSLISQRGPRGSHHARNRRFRRKTHNWYACPSACRNELSEIRAMKRSVLRFVGQ